MCRRSTGFVANSKQTLRLGETNSHDAIGQKLPSSEIYRATRPLLSRIDHATHGRQTRSSSRKRANIFFSRHSSSLTPKNDTPSYRLQLLRVNDVRFYRHLSRTGESFRSTYPYTRVSTVNAPACYIRVRIGQRVDQMARKPTQRDDLFARRQRSRTRRTIATTGKIPTAEHGQ